MPRTPARRALTAAVGACTAAVLLAGCTSAATGGGLTEGSPSPTSTSAASTTGAAAATAKAACTAYAAGTGNPRQVVLTSSLKPVLGPAVALVTINFRDTVAGLAVPTDPQVAAAFTEVVAALDQLNQQLTAGLPEGADATTVPVKVDPTRLRQALDAADDLCAARGVAPKQDTATTASAGAAPTS